MTREVTVDTLMARAGTAVAEAVRRLGSGAETLVLCGPGNNGGDGYVAAAALHLAGIPVRVAASGEPRTDAARQARAQWQGPVETLAAAIPAPVLLDALFGTGLTRPLDADVAERFCRLADAAQVRIAVDVPSGVASDDGAVLGDVPSFGLTLALGAAKPAHLLQPAARLCGIVRVLDIGVPLTSAIAALDRPRLPEPGSDSHKFSRGMVAIAAGSMAGAALLASEAAMRAGAGYVALLGPVRPGTPHALVRKPFDDHALADPRIGALLVGPGLGRDDEAKAILGKALASDCPLVIDGDALHLVTPDQLAGRAGPIILTPHAGEFDALFGNSEGSSKIERTLAAARAAGAIVVFKGADTVIGAPDGQARIAGEANDWLSTAGTGDVLAGSIAATLAAGLAPLDAAAAGVWLHRDAARRAGASFIADDLAAMLTPARASL